MLSKIAEGWAQARIERAAGPEESAHISDSERTGVRAFSRINWSDCPHETMRALGDHELRCLLKLLIRLNQFSGIPGQVWAIALGEAALRFSQQA